MARIYFAGITKYPLYYRLATAPTARVGVITQVLDACDGGPEFLYWPNSEDGLWGQPPNNEKWPTG